VSIKGFVPYTITSTALYYSHDALRRNLKETDDLYGPDSSMSGINKQF
jgi:hypothetical protein